MSNTFKWTAKQRDRLIQVQAVLDEFDAYKPLTLRQIFYQLVGKEFIENTTSQYNMLSNLLKWARLDGFVPWDSIEDRVRAYHCADGWPDVKGYVEAEMENAYDRYRHDLLQSQEKYLEIWLEKDALSSLFQRVARPYCVSTIVCRGFSSVSFLKEFVDRLAYYPSRQPVMLYFGDFDPSGMEMLDAMQRTLAWMHAPDVVFKRVALLKEDIFGHSLPHNPKAIKKKDTRCAKHLAEHGELAVELDALPPAVLEEKIRDAIQTELDMDAFHVEQTRAEQEMDKSNRIHNLVCNLVTKELRAL